jgi:hypothetical protein
VIDSVVIERGLREINPDIHFDMATNLGAYHPMQSIRQGVFFHGQHICSMDRGPVPEFKQWQVVIRTTEVGWEEADKEDVDILWHTVRPDDPEYVHALLRCEARDNSFQIRPDGTVLRLTPVAKRKVRGSVIQVGWRHTFEALLRRDLPKVTRMALAQKFGVDMLAFPVGPPEEVISELLEE